MDPQILFFEQNYGRLWPDEKYEVWPQRSYDEGAIRSGEAVLRLFLLREAANWVELGRKLEFFSSDVEPTPISFELPYGLQGLASRVWGGKVNSRRFRDVWSRDWGRAELPLAIPFDDALMAAMDNLSEERLEFLRLYLFADEREWDYKVSQIEIAQILLGSRERSAYREARMDEMAWAFGGTDPVLEFLGYPSDWRAGSAGDLLLTSDRGGRLDDALHRIEDRVRGIIEREAGRRLAGGQDLMERADEEEIPEEIPEDFRQRGGGDDEDWRR
ncbi:hypothetical protein [Arthrobacter sp. ov118]|uniref:hypothetical protein n=1 Tax=Arthrobacter sp. ov118 TaxID=1761747 RepID=UPI0008EF95F1|nr:hypothetical protein [Arthrobacter sp. ov118]SFU10850.1 hypothetical protein SAMN04487915_11157 [Arthrobacter sp. ov118]